MSLSSQLRSRMISFVSNDYLGLSQHMQVQSDAIRAINLYGTGFCVAPSIGGYSSLQKRLEASLSLFLHTEDTITQKDLCSTLRNLFVNMIFGLTFTIRILLKTCSVPQKS